METPEELLSRPFHWLRNCLYGRRIVLTYYSVHRSIDSSNRRLRFTRSTDSKSSKLCNTPIARFRTVLDWEAFRWLERFPYFDAQGAKQVIDWVSRMLVEMRLQIRYIVNHSLVIISLHAYYKLCDNQRILEGTSVFLLVLR